MSMCMEQPILKEERVRNGDSYPDKQFYIVRRYAWDEGVCSVLTNFIAQMAYMEEIQHHYKEELIPVVDMLNYPSRFWRGMDARKDDLVQNDWLIYFEQPVKDFDLSAAANAEHVILGSDDPQIIGTLRLLNCYWNAEEVKRYHRIYKKYIHFNQRLKKNIEIWEKEFFTPGRRIIGCFERMQIAAGKILMENMSKEEDDAIAKKINVFHWSMSSYTGGQLSKEELTNMLKRMLKEWDATHVLLCIDDWETTEYVKNELGNQALCIPRHHYQIFKDGMCECERFVREIYTDPTWHTLYSMNLAYLTEIVLLSKCTSFVCSKGTGALAALIMNGGQYEHTYISTQPHPIYHNLHRDFFEKYKKVYIYGTGVCGLDVFRHYVQNLGLPIKGFVVSDGRRKQEYINEYPVYELSELKLDKETGLIIAVGDSDEIIANLDRKGFCAYIK